MELKGRLFIFKLIISKLACQEQMDTIAIIVYLSLSLSLSLHVHLITLSGRYGGFLTDYYCYRLLYFMKMVDLLMGKVLEEKLWIELRKPMGLSLKVNTLLMMARRACLHLALLRVRSLSTQLYWKIPPRIGKNVCRDLFRFVHLFVSVTRLNVYLAGLERAAVLGVTGLIKRG